MDKLSIEETKYTPKIEFNAENGKLLVEGKSTPENTFEFFKPALAWLSDYLSSAQSLEFTFNIPYFNSSSSRVLYDIFDLLDGAKNSCQVKVIWLYANGNENGQETGEEFQEDFEDLDITIQGFN